MMATCCHRRLPFLYFSKDWEHLSALITKSFPAGMPSLNRHKPAIRHWWKQRVIDLCSSAAARIWPAGTEINQKLSLLTVRWPPHDARLMSLQRWQQWVTTSIWKLDGWNYVFPQVIMSELMFRVTHPGFSQKPSHSSNNQNRKEKKKNTEKNGPFISSFCVTSQRRSQTAAQTENLFAVTSFQGEPQFTVCLCSVPVGCSLGSYKIIYRWG